MVFMDKMKDMAGKAKSTMESAAQVTRSRKMQRRKPRKIETRSKRQDPSHILYKVKREQIFDIGKNYADMLPLRIQTEDTFRGHLLLTFMATVTVKLMQDRLLDSSYNLFSMFMNLRNLKCKIYGDRIITAEPFKKANDYFKLFGISYHYELMLLE